MRRCSQVLSSTRDDPPSRSHGAPRPRLPDREAAHDARAVSADAERAPARLQPGDEPRPGPGARRVAGARAPRRASGTRGYARLATGPGSRTAKYRQLFAEALDLLPSQVSILARADAARTADGRRAEDALRAPAPLRRQRPGRVRRSPVSTSASSSICCRSGPASARSAGRTCSPRRRQGATSHPSSTTSTPSRPRSSAGCSNSKIASPSSSVNSPNAACSTDAAGVRSADGDLRNRARRSDPGDLGRARRGRDDRQGDRPARGRSRGRRAARRAAGVLRLALSRLDVDGSRSADRAAFDELYARMWEESVDDPRPADRPPRRGLQPDRNPLRGRRQRARRGRHLHPLQLVRRARAVRRAARASQADADQARADVPRPGRRHRPSRRRDAVRPCRRPDLLGEPDAARALPGLSRRSPDLGRTDGRRRATGGSR